MNSDLEKPNECPGKACQWISESAWCFMDSISPSPQLLQSCGYVFSNCPASSVQKQIPHPPQERWGQKGKKSCFLLEPWHSGAVQECTYSRIFPHSWVVERNQQRHVPYTPQISELATTKDTHSELSALGQQLLSVSYSSHDAVSALTSTSYQKAYHTSASTWENHTNEFTQ